MKLENIQPSGKAVKLEPTHNTEVVSSSKSYPEMAIGMYRIPQDGTVSAKFVLIEIPYDPTTGETGQAKEVYRDIREDSIEKFKVKVDELGFFSGEKRS
jgi:hypothetical protein